MKKVTQLTAAIALASAGAFAVPAATADVSATAGVVTDYYFRGQNLGNAAPFASLDYSNEGFYVGVWAIDDGATADGLDIDLDAGTVEVADNDGLEVDFYFGYGQELDAFSWNVGYNHYNYTYTTDFEHELGLSVGFAEAFSADLFLGRDEDVSIDEDTDYLVLQLGYAVGAMALTVGHYEIDENVDADIAEGDYQWAEVSFSGELVEGIDLGLNIGVAQDDGTDDDGYMFLTASKSFDL